MGNKQSLPFDRERMDEYLALTQFNEAQILDAWKRFNEYNSDRDSILTREELLTMPELSVNPFRERIATVFSSDGSGNMTFEDFLDFLSVFGAKASADLKSSYAFRIYDMDDDGFIGREDLIGVMKLMTGDAFSTDEREQILAKLMEECDLDGDERISFVEFDNVIKRSPDFASTFHIKL